MGAPVRLCGLILLAGLSVLVSGCATLVRGTEQEVTIETEPAGADVLLSTGERCTTPCHLTADRDQILTARISRPDCRSVQGQLVPSVIDGITLFGSIYDYQLGGAYDLEPNPLKVRLICGEAARRISPGLTPEDIALLQGIGQPVKELGGRRRLPEGLRGAPSGQFRLRAPGEPEAPSVP